MSLVVRINPTQATNPNLIVIYDTTGDYDPATNPTGFGTPNPTRAQVTEVSLAITLPNQTTPTTYDIFPTPNEFLVTNTVLYYTPALGGSIVGTSISDASNATPINIETATGHGRTTGDSVAVVEVFGNLAANGYWTATVVDTTNITLEGSAGSGAYTSGGYMVYDSAATDFVDGVYLFELTATIAGSEYTATSYYLHTPLIECCIAKYSSRINPSNCNDKSWKRYTEMKSMLQRAHDAMDCGSYDIAQDIVDRLTKLCNDCGCGCGGGC